MPGIESDEAITDDVIAKVVPECHSVTCYESGCDVKFARSTDTGITGVKRSKKNGTSIGSDELEETNVRIAKAKADANGYDEDRSPSPKNEIYNYFIETELPGGVVIRTGGRTCDFSLGCLHAH